MPDSVVVGEEEIELVVLETSVNRLLDSSRKDEEGCVEMVA